MKLTNTKLTGLSVAFILTFCSFYTFAEETHVTQAVMHADAAAKATDGKSIVEHAEVAMTHAKTADEHLDAGIKSLDATIEHGRQGHVDLAKKSAEAAVTHLGAAQ